MIAQTTTQRTAKHRLAVKERLQRYGAALELIANDDFWFLSDQDMRQIAKEALEGKVLAKS